jgi:L-threonylcarbamoyladenylate synthase
MQTRRLRVATDQAGEQHPAIVEAAAILRAGGLVAIPTETVYGLAANALDPAALAKIFAAKQRPAWDPLIVHIASAEMLSQVSRAPQAAAPLAERFWPGPLTLVLPKSERIPEAVTAGRDSVAVRIPSHPVAQAVLRACGLPLAAPSANRFGHTSPTTAEHVLADLDGRIDAVLDAGPTPLGVESTVLDPLHRPPLLLRPGGVTREQLESVLGPIEVYTAPPDARPEALASPGLAARHYAPQARLAITGGSQAEFTAALEAAREQVRERGEYVGALAPTGWIVDEQLAAGGLVLFDWGDWGDWDALARNLFTGIRYLDKPGVALILAPLPPQEGLAAAVRDRLVKASQS